MTNSTMSPGKRVLTAALLSATAFTGVAGVAAASPTSNASLDQQRAQVLPQELRGHQQDDQQVGFAGEKSVKLRVMNETDTRVWVRDYNADTKTLRPGDHYDVSDWAFWAGHADVMTDISIEGGGTPVTAWGYNPLVGYPSVGVGNQWDRYSVGESHVKTTDSGFKIKVTRQADEDMKLFTLEVTR